MNKTTIIMSKEEAMALPLNERPLCYRITNEMYMAVWDAIGEAVNCYDPKPDDKTFLAEKASDVAVKLCFKIANEIERTKSLNEDKWICPACRKTYGEEIQSCNSKFETGCGVGLNLIKKNIDKV